MKSIRVRLSVLYRVADIYAARLFVVVSLLFGLGVVFVLPPLFGNDEIVHFPRAYQISQGQMWEEKLEGYDYGGQVPEHLKWFNDDFRQQVQAQTADKTRLHELINRYSHEKITSDKKVGLAFTSAGVYAPWSYLPSAIGVGLANLLQLPLTWYVWLGRIAGLLAWIGLTYWAIRLLPTGKFFMVVIALLPTSIVQAATIGMDGVVNGLAWVIIAMTFAVMAGSIKLTVKRALLLAGLCFFLATTKQGYMPIALFPLIIPAALYTIGKKKAALSRIIFGVGLIAATQLYISKTLPLTSVLHYVQRPGVNVDSHAQIIHIIEHPFEVLNIILIQPFTMYAGGVWAGTVGVLTNKTIYLPVLVIGLLYVSLLFAFALGVRIHRFAGRYAKRIGFASILTALATFVLINLALYVAFTTVGYPHVEGLQGRYFLPFAPLAIGVMDLLPRKVRWSLPGWMYIVPLLGVFAGLTITIVKISQLL